MVLCACFTLEAETDFGTSWCQVCTTFVLQGPTVRLLQAMHLSLVACALN